VLIYRINFYFPPYQFETSLYVKFGKLWNVKFLTKCLVH